MPTTGRRSSHFGIPSWLEIDSKFPIALWNTYLIASYKFKISEFFQRHLVFTVEVKPHISFHEETHTRYERNLRLDFGSVLTVTHQAGMCTILVQRKLLEVHHVSHGLESMGTEHSDLYPWKTIQLTLW